MSFQRTDAFPYHDLDRDLDAEEDDYQTRTVANNGHLHLRFPQAERSDKLHRQNNTLHNDQNEYHPYSERNDDQLLQLNSIYGTSTPCTTSEVTADGDVSMLGYYDDDDALLRLENEIDEEEDEVKGIVDVVFDFMGKCYVVWPHRYFPGSIIILIATLILTGVVGGLALWLHPPQKILDDILEDASMGFETRGTDIRKAMSTGGRIREAVRSNESSYSLCPDMPAALEKLNLPVPPMPGLPNATRIEQTKFLCTHPNYGTHDTPRRKRAAEPLTDWPDSAKNYIPLLDIGSYLMFVLESTTGNDDMFNVKAIHDLCDFTKKKIIPMFPTSGSLKYDSHRDIAQMIQLYHDLPSCKAITQADIDEFRINLHACKSSMPQFRSDNRTSTNTTIEPTKCQNEWKILFIDTALFLLDADFMQNANPKGAAKYTAVLVSTKDPMLLTDDDQLDFYVDHLEGKDIRSDGVRLTAVKFPMGEDLKWELFQKYIVSDMRWFLLALCLVVGVMLLYMLRIDLVIATLISICAGFILAYATYYIVYGFKFFPFINVLGLLILIAIGADDVFVFFDIFEQVRVKHANLPLNRIISKTLSHAVASIFVTSFTTASAFFANSVSHITSIKLFGIFAGTAVLWNFIVMVLVVPSVIVIAELILKALNIEKCRMKLLNFSGQLPKLICSRERAMPSKVLRYTWLIWIILLSLLGIGGFIVVFVWPRFQLPVTADFQLFPASDCMENWDLSVRKHFQFEAEEEEQNNIAFYYVWGFQSDDPGSHLNPKDTDGPLKVESSFDFYDEKTQIWLYKYCQKVQSAKYTYDYYKTSLVCTFDAYKHVIKNICTGPVSGFVNATIPECCESSQVPFSRKQLESCAPIYEYLYYHPFPLKVGKFVVGVIDVGAKKKIFDRIIFTLSNNPNKTNNIAAYIMQVNTKYTATYNYDVMDKYYEELSESFAEEVQKGPKPIQKGFCAFTDWFWFYDLQRSLATGTYYSIGLSLLVAFLVMLLTSLNPVITLYAMLTISFAIACTVAVLVLMGWHLNVIESVIISLSVGLSIDFAIHYGVAYRLSKENNSKLRTAESYERVGPAVAMAAVTTFLAGAAMMPCHVIAYTKLGIFLMFVMTFAWIYATLFFQSLCWIIGPIGCCCFGIKNESRVQVPVQVRGGDVNMRPMQEHSDDDSLLVTF